MKRIFISLALVIALLSFGSYFAKQAQAASHQGRLVFYTTTNKKWLKNSPTYSIVVGVLCDGSKAVCMKPRYASYRWRGRAYNSKLRFSGINRAGKYIFYTMAPSNVNYLRISYRHDGRMLKQLINNMGRRWIVKVGRNSMIIVPRHKRIGR
ncbi:MAG: hypothetical protein GXP43_01525 [bacterium]|nr:hypothetical protein [bacterium]